MSLTDPLPDDASPHAALGTAAHALAALCLETGQDAESFTGRVIEGHDVTADMAEHVQVYVQYCRTILASSPDVQHRIEHRFTLGGLDAPAPMFGTADFVAWYGGTLWVVDLKYGQGVQVQAEGNPQLRYYALGALLSLPDVAVQSVHATIVQPRAPGGPAIRTTCINPTELVEWSVELMDRARAALQPDAPLVPGDWCSDTFCKARGSCTARAALAGLEFTSPPPTLPDPRLMTLQQVGRALSMAGTLESFLSDLRQHATAELNRGADVPGWKLFPTEARAGWRDAAEAEAALDVLHDLGDARWTPREVVSPAVARGILTDRLRASHKTKKAAELAARAELAPLIVKASSGVKLAPDADSRLALPPAGSEFT